MNTNNMISLPGQLADKRERFRVSIRKKDKHQLLAERRKELNTHLFEQSLKQDLWDESAARTILNTDVHQLLKSRALLEATLKSRALELTVSDLQLLTAYQLKTGIILKDVLSVIIHRFNENPLAGISPNEFNKYLEYFAVCSSILGATQTLPLENIQMFNIFVGWWNEEVKFAPSALNFYVAGAFIKLVEIQAEKQQPSSLQSNLIIVLIEVINDSEQVLDANLLTVILTLTVVIKQASRQLFENEHCMDKIFRNICQNPLIVIEIIHNLSFEYQYAKYIVRNHKSWIKYLPQLFQKEKFTQRILESLTNLTIDEISCQVILQHKNIIDCVLSEKVRRKFKEEVNEFYLELVAHANLESKKRLLETFDIFSVILNETEWSVDKVWLMKKLIRTVSNVQRHPGIIAPFLHEIRKKIEEANLDWILEDFMDREDDQ